ncbi:MULTISPECIES: trypsin-like peptidase domain-containing protein [unclassified Streptomyces]|uniref:S1C family serine protease n=1 Tax=unclassified Streptomyces TaxID=2593676 RepID=UPI002DD7E048|nr:trypsin-like peptidase domain-containing protein [Streptomyces sp. NBC_01750]WSB00492.1 trypsin-like peptidase domain-containing protein [Streptomyces sp. NBC_01794]WSD35150.1 trypsin-like peptidase domain-containing protein [Streptomyces sp. NBC_01750]
MDDGKPTGPKAKWWSRPSAGRTAHSEPEAQTPAAAPVPGETEVTAELPPVQSPVPLPRDAETAADPVLPAAQPAPEQGRPQPLHEPDPYSTPPYGGPGPWAPAPPVQRPMPTPAQGTPVPSPYPAPNGTPAGGGTGGGYAPPPAPSLPQSHDQPQSPLQPQQQPQERPQPLSSLWLQYDPWSAPGQPLTHSGEPVRRKGRRGSLLVGAVLLALVAGAIGGGTGAYIERNGGITSVELPQSVKDDGKRAPDSVAGIAASALPSVVTLHVSGGGEQGTGTGFVLDQQGHILTNNHVVDPAGSSGEISVTFSGGESAKATLVGKDSGYDLAVVKVSGVTGLKPLPLGNSENVQVGDPVVAIGAPFDLQNTVTSGIISAKERPITAGGEKGDGSDVSYVDALQTDAPINPGNSGGPLVDTKARVIGINSAIRAADSGTGTEGGQAGSIGLGFAIPINQGKRVAEELINTGKATHPVIGVSLDMKYTGDGARVGDKGKDGSPSVTRSGPGAKAGIKAGDVITKIDGQRVHSGEELIVKIRAHRPGDRLELTVVRAGRERRMTLTLGSASGT